MNLQTEGSWEERPYTACLQTLLLETSFRELVCLQSVEGEGELPQSLQVVSEEPLLLHHPVAAVC